MASPVSVCACVYILHACICNGYDNNKACKAMTSQPNNFLMIGCGNMGGALLRGWRAAGALHDYSEINVVKRSLPDAENTTSGVHYFTNLSDIPSTPSIVILAVKPQQLDEVLIACKTQFGDAPIYLSIAAGKTIASMQSILGVDAKIIRAMPNTPVQIGKGITGLATTKNISVQVQQQIQSLFAAVGMVVWIAESEMDAFTALAGSGPAYVFYFMECLAQAAVSLGISEVDADKIARQMVYGAGALAVKSSDSLVMLRENVTSKGGTTEAALNVLMQAGTLDAPIKAALEAAVKRAREMNADSN
jgi:pyrroline-5-carboxylate reductase